MIMMAGNIHVPVLVNEVLAAIEVRAHGAYIDCTLGAGGHAEATLRAGHGTIKLLGIDADPEAMSAAEGRLTMWRDSVTFAHGNFGRLLSIAKDKGFVPADGLLFDLGLSSMQLSATGRGFSFQYDVPLDMRFDPLEARTAGDIVNGLSETELGDMIFRYGEEGRSRQIARAIVRARPIATTGQLARTVEAVLPKRKGRIHVATRTFQAIRIAVNNELASLESALVQGLDVLRPGGRLVVISYHSLEDRIVKQFFRRESKGCVCPPRTPACVCGRFPRLRTLYSKAVKPSAEEVKANRRSRSARLRAAEILSI
ncbi:MAG: 16S rRNA (cytosine(1402)-N(4))-methyltransferase RsmH [Dehalococcoidia bacterium]|nr:16S rRNA (cytosine(1402)-N(4))-methyltransferase RsmH [Dehalococcoidia bacterium]